MNRYVEGLLCDAFAGKCVLYLAESQHGARAAFERASAHALAFRMRYDDLRPLCRSFLDVVKF